MPLDPQAQAFLEQLAATGAPPLHELSVAEARQVIVALFGTQGDPEPVGAVAERTIPGAGGEMPTRIYTPYGTGPFPVLVYLHGGGWVIGNLEAYDATCRALTNAAGLVGLQRADDLTREVVPVHVDLLVRAEARRRQLHQPRLP